MFPKRICAAIACASIAAVAGGCASAPSLDDAKLTGISLLSPEDRVGRAKSRWPTLRLTFQSDRPLFDHDTTPPRVQFEICDASGDERHLYGFGLVEVIWQGEPITESAALEIQSLDQPQEYEVEFDYVYWEDSQNRSRPDSVTLLPLPGDLCIAFRKGNKPLPPSIGRPLRINRDTVNKTVGPLPRLISIP
jgi:hypothetical protein